ncbi:hypothetical protein BG261_02805 [Floricoccus tropicus]|uniref:Phage protein n=1 Tax=Floricoccus tropicus TaxID=1859473 RepID=A0A1E8GNE8_9LACT|nr:hypothetical protein [Floricoccus tropicus]OFI49526.1 hypothetical protein BG261_02805 [Floricoccus tropicus]
MSKQGFKLNYAGIGQLMKSSGMQSMLEEKASEVQGRAGPGYKKDIYVGKTRANAMVYASTYEAKKDNKKNNTLLKAVR